VNESTVVFDDDETIVPLVDGETVLGVLSLRGEIDVGQAALVEVGTFVGRVLDYFVDMSALRTVDRQFRAVVDATPDVVTIRDREGRFVYANEAIERYIGKTPAEALGRSVAEVTTAATAELVDRNDRLVLDTGTVVRVEDSVVLDDFEYVFEGTHAPMFDEFGEIEGVLSIGHDVTAAKRYENQLSTLYQGTERLLLAETTDAVAELAVELLEDVFGFPLSCVFSYDQGTDSLLPVAWADGLAAGVGEPAPLPRTDCAIWRVFERDEVETDVEDVAGETGTVGWSDLLLPLGPHGVIVVGTGGEPFENGNETLAKVLLASIESILDRVDREADLHEREQALARQNERLEEFASVVSHDLRNPLSIAHMYLELASETRHCEYHEDVRDALVRMDTLISDLLTLARQGRAVGETESVSLALQAGMAWSAVDTGDAVLVLEDDLGTVEADPRRLQQLFENLFRNAVEHGSTTPERAAKHRSKTADSPPTRVEVGRLERGGFYVGDDGPGIDPERRELVFERGFTTSDDGTGFGLAIVESVVTAHGWTISVTDGPTGGATFEIRT
jgi:PAS domain S-box-containing protein